MAKLKFNELRQLEKLFNMGGGYVLNFSNRTLQEFVYDSVEADIYDERYNYKSGSKANRLRAFLNSEPEHHVGKLIQDLIDIAEEIFGDKKANEISNCRKIANGLLSTHAQNWPQSPVPTPRFDTNSPQPPIPAPCLDTGPAPKSIPASSITEIFFSYAHEDEDLMNEVRRQLTVFEREKRIVKWHDRMIPPGSEWKNQIDSGLQNAKIILLFMSPHFIESKYCYEIEGKEALKRHESGEAVVIPVVLRPCAWDASPFGKLQALPKEAKPISTWNNLDSASLDVARKIMAKVDELTQSAEQT